MTSITQALGQGAGIDTKALVSQLVDAQFANRTREIGARQERLSAQISALSRLRSGLSGFSTALGSLVDSGSLSTQPASADPGVLGVGRLPGANVAGLSAEIEVRQLAAAQVVTSPLLPGRSAPVGRGQLTISLGTVDWAGDVPNGLAPRPGSAPVTITIGEGNDSLQGLAGAINAARAGLTASVISDADGARLSIKGPTGVEQGFTITVAEDPAAPGLAAFAFAPGAAAMTVTRKAGDSVVAVDGVTVRRPGNSIADLVPGIRLDLVRAEPGRPVAVTTAPQTAGLAQAVADIVATYNELIGIAREDTDPVAGVLSGDAGGRAFMARLGGLTNRQINPAAAPGEPLTLGELGVGTTRDGTLVLDQARLQRVLADNGAAVERMLTVGLGRELRQMSADLTRRGGGIAASEAGFQRLSRQLATEQGELVREADQLRTRLTRQFAGMDARVSAYRATQSFLDQQIKSWTAER
jgi:flagellar hook-associated protein 2